MKKIILTHGLIAGLITGLMMFITIPLHKSGTLDLDAGMIIGFATMFIALTLVYFGIRSIRDKHFNGRISFVQGLSSGILIALIASLVYCVSWEICYHTFAQGFEDTYSQMYLDNLKAEGVSEEVYQQELIKMNEFKTNYKNPTLRFGMTLIEIFPVGIIFSIISALILKRNKMAV